jgi:fatty-acyl-CoA synthase
VAPGPMTWLDPRRVLDLAFRARSASEYLIFQGERITRRQAYADVRALAAGLQSLGVQKGDRVATLLPACPEAVYSMFVPSITGSIHVPLNPLLGEYELRYILADCGAKVVITGRRWYGLDHPAMLARMLPDLPALKHVLVRGTGDGDCAVFRPLADVMGSAGTPRPVKVSLHEPATLTYTSGTTGRPKGALHSRTWRLLARLSGSRLGLSSLRCLLLPYPPHHFAGMVGIMASLLAGGKVILMERFDPEQMLEVIQRERVTQIGGSPTMYRWLLCSPGQERYDLSSVQRITASSERLPPDLVRALHDRFGCSLENFYGTTETNLISWTAVDDPWERAATTVGKPVPGVSVRVVDDERQPLPAGAPGEIAVRAPQIMLGYYNDPALTAQVLDADGWFYTGDVGYLGDDGYLRLVDRKRDTIIRGGQNVYPAEIEQYLEQHPLIRRAGVVGVPGRLGSEEVWAYLELQPGALLTEREVMDYCRGQIATFKIPEQVRFAPQLPATAAGKVQRFRLRELANEEMGAHGPD